MSPLYYEQLFHMEVFCAALMCLQFECVIVCQKDICTKAALETKAAVKCCLN